MDWDNEKERLVDKEDDHNREASRKLTHMVNPKLWAKGFLLLYPTQKSYRQILKIGCLNFLPMITLLINET